MILRVRRSQLLSFKCQSTVALCRSAALGIQERGLFETTAVSKANQWSWQGKQLSRLCFFETDPQRDTRRRFHELAVQSELSEVQTNHARNGRVGAIRGRREDQPAHLIGQIERNVISRIIEEKVNLGLIHSLHSCD